MDDKLFQALGQSRDCSGQLIGNCCEVVHQRTEAQPCGAMKVAKACNEGCRFETHRQQ